MGLCRFSAEYLIDNYTLVDNMFISEYLPFAEPDAVKAYLFGLFQCQNPASKDNALEYFSRALSIGEDKILDAFAYWEDMGLVRIVSKNPLEICYLPVKSSLTPPKKYNKEKYSDFNRQLQELFPERQLSPNEYLQYYDLIESYRIQPEAALMIAAYCVGVKGVSVRYPYIVAVAKDWASEGGLTVEDVEEKLKEHEASTENLRAVFAALGKKSAPDFDDRQLYLKWEKNWSYNRDAIIFAAKLLKKRGGMARLDGMLDEFYRMGIYTADDMKVHAEYRDKVINLSITINRILGIYYQSLDHIIETYISPWLNKGFEEEALLKIADLCFKRSYRTLEKMNNIVNELYKKGFITSKGIDEYIEECVRYDAKIKQIIEASGSVRMVTMSDRDFYKTWTEAWDMSEELILTAAELSLGRAHNFAYMSKLLSDWRDKKITDPEQAKKAAAAFTQSQKPKNPQLELANNRDYSNEDLNAIFGSLEDLKNLEV